MVEKVPLVPEPDEERDVRPIIWSITVFENVPKDHFQDVVPARKPEEIPSQTLLNLDAGSFIGNRVRGSSVKHDSLNARLQSSVD